MVESKAIRRTPLAARRIVTKGFAVILDLICMLMVMDVYLLLFPSFVAAWLSESRFARSEEMQVAAMSVLSGRAASAPVLYKSVSMETKH